MDSTRFTFVRDQHGRFVGCIAYRIDKKHGALEYEVSTHNPKDEYDRKLARFVAEGRMKKHPRKLSFNPKLPPKLDSMLEDVVWDLIDSDSIPNRLRKALTLRLKFIAAQRFAAEEAKFVRRPVELRPADSVYDPNNEF